MDPGTLKTALKDEKAQLHTLEAVIASMMVVGIIIFTVQATSLTPLTASTANSHIEAQLQTIGQDMMNALSYSPYGHSSDLKNDILNWDGDSYVWSGAEYRATGNQSHSLENSSLAESLDMIAVRRGIAHNVHFTWVNEDGIVLSRRYIYNGDPSNNAVVISKMIHLCEAEIGNATEFRERTGIPSADPDTPSTDFYNIVNVKMTLWRM